MLPDFQLRLTEYMDNNVADRMNALTAALAAVVQPDNFRAMMTEVLDNRALLREVAHRSVWHPNGFAKVVLMSEPSYELRLHIWRRDSYPHSDIREDVHNHRWDFSTVLLTGGYRHQIFQPDVRGDTFFAYNYSVSSDSQSYAFASGGTQTMRCVLDSHLSEGSGYTISSEVLHRVIPDNRHSVISLVLVGPRLPSNMEVFATEELSQTSTEPFSKPSLDFLLHHMRGVLSLPRFHTGQQGRIFG